MSLRIAGFTVAVALAAVGFMPPGPASASEAGHRRQIPVSGTGSDESRTAAQAPAGEAGTSAWCRRSGQGDGERVAPKSGQWSGRSAYGHC
ncbi:hypothetical protein [Streptomyces spectabilis]|uniref:Uncharacterized protein n=1 Tax=Streptomyces spectabilis TaxID=68270 RepID=A0A5P2X3N7_STRST|nr:hypothetical protein [Streptomyces spectabilis]MBB5107464.1 hypothetical protein [Streptomyces spectabilis]MCI3900152.1 hypothetical protein [Streptomyces spectabilis]QEV57765.1 hypothetical protein CP982_02765 [Streptomyces spectabilis]GGV37803.1 hypothetical protein GCM10010245_60170 [Streptomyces spectabilis]